MNPGGPHHIADARLAEIASGTGPESTEELHLSHCRHCASIHAELVRARVEGIAHEVQAPAEILAAGHAFVNEVVGAGKQSSFRRAPVARLRPTRLRWTFAAAVIAVVLMVGVGGRFMRSGESLPPSVLAALVEQSAHGLVHEAVADADEFEAPVLRGPAGGIEPETLDELRGRVVDSSRSVDDQINLITALQAARRFRESREELGRALEPHPHHEELRTLEVHQLFAEGRLDDAERMLRAQLVDTPDDPVLELNLAIVLYTRGVASDDESALRESRYLAERIVTHQPGTGLSQRAQRLLDD